MEKINIRKAEIKDTDKIWQIFKDVVKSGDTYVFDPNISKEEAIAYWMRQDKHCYVVDLNGEILGTYIIKDNHPALGSHVANASFMVSANARGKSIGSKMGEHALQEAKLLGYKAMQFNMVISTNEIAVKLWKKLGFKIIGTIPEAFSHQGLNRFVDAYIMFRRL